MQPTVMPFFDTATFTYSYVVRDPDSKACAIIDAVLGYDAPSGRVSTESAQGIVDYVTKESLEVHWLLDTHVHADHLSAARYLKHKLGGQTAIGCQVSQVQQTFSKIFNTGTEFASDGRQFDRLLPEDAAIRIGGLTGQVLSTPGHTPDSVSYLFPGVGFVGDTLFMPDYGTARTDFPGGDAATLYLSIQRIFALPADTKLYLCHDYLTEDRDAYCCVTTVDEQRANNIHINDSITPGDFVAQRETRDQVLAAPKLLYPSVQFNMRGGAFPAAEGNGTHYFKIPLRVDACPDLSIEQHDG